MHKHMKLLRGAKVMPELRLTPMMLSVEVPPRPQHFSLDVDDGSGFAMGPTVPQPPVGMQPGAGMFYQAQQAAMMQQGL